MERLPTREESCGDYEHYKNVSFVGNRESCKQNGW